MKKQFYDTVIVGAGASGLVAAIEASSGNGKVLILERMDAPGKKILATGNGKCNMTNLYMREDCYRGSGSQLAKSSLSQMSPEKLRRYFYDLGLWTIERDGYVYPVTEQAKTVLFVLLSALEKKQVAIHTKEQVTKLKPLSKGGYEIQTDQGCYQAANVVLATGSKASPKLGSDGSGYSLLKDLGIRMRKPLPALTALTSPKKIFKTLSGVRTKGALTLRIDGEADRIERGEIQLTAYGISGIPVFQLSRYAVKALDQKKKTECVFDFYPDFDFQELRKMVRDFRKIPGISAEDVLRGIAHEKWVPHLLKEAGISGKDKAEKLPEKSWNKLVHLMKEYPIPLDGYRDFEFAQACQGGALADEITNEMETKKYKGLYLTGELVDVDGTCGGYNLHWAFLSGYLAGKAIGKKGKRTKA